MFERKSKLEKPNSKGIVVTEYINEEMSRVYSMLNTLEGKRQIELLTIGDDENGATIQVRASRVDCADEINSWLSRSIRKVERISWVEIEITGYDSDGDHRNGKVKFPNELGDAFLFICDSKPFNETPLHQLLMVSTLSH